jgi:hypothetical protein
VKILAVRPYLLALAVLALGSLPMATRADSLTLNGATIDSFSQNTSKDTFTVALSASSASQYFWDETFGTKISSLTVDDFGSTHGGYKLLSSDVFTQDIVTSYQYQPGSFGTIVDVTFKYASDPKNNNTVPEPSSAALLATGLIGLIGLGRKKLFSR